MKKFTQEQKIAALANLSVAVMKSNAKIIFTDAAVAFMDTLEVPDDVELHVMETPAIMYVDPICRGTYALTACTRRLRLNYVDRELLAGNENFAPMVTAVESPADFTARIAREFVLEVQAELENDLKVVAAAHEDAPWTVGKSFGRQLYALYLPPWVDKPVNQDEVAVSVSHPGVYIRYAKRWLPA